MKTLKTIPHFHNEKEEKDFWESHDSTDYIAWNNAKVLRFPHLWYIKMLLQKELSGV